MEDSKRRLLSNPYKTRLWLSGLDGSIFCQKEIELWAYLAHWGPKGCDSWNYKLQKQIKRSRRQVQRYLKNLEKHYMIVIIPGWSKLAGGKFEECLRNRKIYAMPWQSKKAWIAASVQKNLGLQGVIFDTLQKRIIKNDIKESAFKAFSEEEKMRIVNQIQSDGGLKYSSDDKNHRSNKPHSIQSQGVALKPTSPSGLTGSRLIKPVSPAAPQKFQKLIAGHDPNFSDVEKMIFLGYKKKFLSLNYPEEKAISLANIKTALLSKRK
jgi:hypothetical protein